VSQIRETIKWSFQEKVFNYRFCDENRGKQKTGSSDWNLPPSKIKQTLLFIKQPNSNFVDLSDF